MALSSPTQTALKGLRELANISLCRSATRRDIFEIYFVQICNCRSVRMDGPNQIVRIDVIELIARTLVEHVGVDPVGSQQ